ncbi:hypothetical protein KCP69_22630 [Salmonella enterica subsp. enterica]|nr:hypothetical protein KCP69_22630 [Salmonella enterica subsp. enterica]
MVWWGGGTYAFGFLRLAPAGLFITGGFARASRTVAADKRHRRGMAWAGRQFGHAGRRHPGLTRRNAYFLRRRRRLLGVEHVRNAFTGQDAGTGLK